MMWTAVDQPMKEPESELQALFDHWPAREGWVLAGVPSWLSTAGGKNDRSRVATSLNYAFTPDVKWPGLVIELKSGAKDQPLGLAEVLHHARMLSDVDGVLGRGGAGVQLRPVLVSTWNGWNRAAIAYLFKNGLEQEAFAYLEVTILRTRERAIAWFDEPFGGWEDAARPPVSPPSPAAGRVYWHKAKDADVWFGTDKRHENPPTFHHGAVTVIARVSGEPPTYVAWVGESTTDAGAYFVSQ